MQSALVVIYIVGIVLSFFILRRKMISESNLIKAEWGVRQDRVSLDALGIVVAGFFSVGWPVLLPVAYGVSALWFWDSDFVLLNGKWVKQRAVRPNKIALPIAPPVVADSKTWTGV